MIARYALVVAAIALALAALNTHALLAFAVAFVIAGYLPSKASP